MSYHAQHRVTSSWSAILAALAGCAFAACTDPTSPAPSDTSTEATADLGASGKRHAGAVYTTTNGAGSNAIIAFGRAADGSLTRIGRFPT
ncbi:MAG TPA: hypothetical protein VH700_11675, partial [Gemmatimonadales bacterium]